MIDRDADGPHQFVRLSAVLAALALAWSCGGDNPTEPPPTPDPPRSTTVTVSPVTVELTALGATVQLSAEVRDRTGQAMAGTNVTWQSSAAAVATVSGSGLVTAAGNGTATVTATSGGASGSAAVTVAQEVSAVAVSSAEDTVVQGNTLRLAAEASDANGHPVAGAAFAWASSDTLVASVDDSGLVTGVAAGDVEISATSSGVTGLAALTVTAPVPTIVEVIPDTVALTALGQTAQLVAEVQDQVGRVMEGQAVAWASTDTLVATVDSAGLVTAAGQGTTPVVATAGDISGEAVVTVTQLSDRDIMVALYEATRGRGWTNSDGWLTDVPLGEWYGVDVNGDGQVVRLHLEGNNLSGPLPTELVGLASLKVLSLYGNALAGPIPAELGHLANLTRLNLTGNEFTGSIPPQLIDLASLEVLNLAYNELTGSIPSELGSLSRLRNLYIAHNELTGSIPPELGNLAALGTLDIFNNNLTGPIPPELGNLANLRRLDLTGNEFTGSIPPQLVDLASLEVLNLAHNELTGPIPPELGTLANLKDLSLSDNNLRGRIPPELGRLSNLSTLLLEQNELSGPVPPELRGLSTLRELGLTHNPGLEGPLPAALTDLTRLSVLLAGGTDLCAPTDAAFQDWLDRVHKRRIAACTEGDPPMAYLTQAVQSREHPVPLVAGEQALLRAFLTANRTTSQGIPALRVRFYVDGRETHVENIPGKSAPIPTELDESSLSKSVNAEIPGRVVQPGLEMVIEVDPDGTLDSSLLGAKRIPETGRLAVDVRAMPLFDLTLIPFIWSETHDSSIVDLVATMAADPESHEMLRSVATLLPVGDLAVTAHEPVLSTTNNAGMLLSQTVGIRAMEGGSGHYLGMMSRPTTGAHGLARRTARSAFSLPHPFVIAHELGHTFDLDHAAACGAMNTDPSFPYPDGSIGTWGYDFHDGGRLVPPVYNDLMGYCNQDYWISDYHFTNALRHRLVDEVAPAAVAAADVTRGLLLWGGIDADTVPYLEPAFVVDAPPALPGSAGTYTATGRTAGGAELFSLSFAMPETSDGDGSSSFAFVLPVRAAWEGSLAAITLVGPGGSFTLDGESDFAMAILRNPRTGQVRGILRDPPASLLAPAAAAAGSLAPGVEMLFSRGIPETAAW